MAGRATGRAPAGFPATSRDGTPRIFRFDDSRQRNSAPAPERSSQQSTNPAPKIYRPPDDPTREGRRRG
jgi:hypothetical protein